MNKNIFYDEIKIIRREIKKRHHLPYFTVFKDYEPRCGIASLKQAPDVFHGHLAESFEYGNRVYIFKAHCTGLYKIGTSKDPIDRLNHLKTSFRRLTLVATYPGGTLLEKFIHSEFKSVREFGEWFNLGENARIKVGRAVRVFNAVGYFYFLRDSNKKQRKELEYERYANRI